jgi:hypothetical protein
VRRTEVQGSWAIPPNSTPFPNALLDRVMPSLRDTEWRILCVVVRQTLGWRSVGGKHRKTTDWLTQGQLKRRTGRESAAVSQAIECLTRKGLLHVRDERGVVLRSARARRRNRGRLYFTTGENCNLDRGRNVDNGREK